MRKRCSILACNGLLILYLLLRTSSLAHAEVYYVTVAGLGGEPDYDKEFTSLALGLNRLLVAEGGDAHVDVLTGRDSTRARFIEVLNKVAENAKPTDDFVLILIGHGTYDGIDYKFNLIGPDITAAELARLCNPIQAGRQLIVNTTSSSGGSIVTLERRGRAVIAATKTGTEKNATVFARYWIESLQDPAADVDKNESITALEAFQYATHKTAEFYESQKRLATEHATFDDTGQHEPVRVPAADSGEGRLMSSFTLIRFGATQKQFNDPAKRKLLARKEELERQIDTLKYQKAAMSQEDYKQQLTTALLALARVQAELDK